MYRPLYTSLTIFHLLPATLAHMKQRQSLQPTFEFRERKNMSSVSFLIHPLQLCLDLQLDFVWQGFAAETRGSSVGIEVC
jgi:hypothetical protein